MSRAWVGDAVGLLEPLRGDVGVDLRCPEARVAQEFLDGAEVRSPVEEVCGSGVTQSVRSRRPAPGDVGEEPGYQFVDGPGAEPRSA